MLTRLVSVFLIPVFVLGHALPPSHALTHSHAGTGIAEPADHASRPHVHLSGGHSHAHSHGDDHAVEHHHLSDSDHSANGAVIGLCPHHDADAIYFSRSCDSVARTTQTEFITMDGLVEGIPFEVVFTGAPSRDRDCDPPDRCSTLPIYLMTASLRL